MWVRAERKSADSLAHELGVHVRTVYKWLTNAEGIIESELRDVRIQAWREGVPVNFVTIVMGGDVVEVEDDTLVRAVPELSRKNLSRNV